VYPLNGQVVNQNAIFFVKRRVYKQQWSVKM